jgi:enamine deaminase RidA (YjgF/YER057c/UK114 family)/N-acetylglutamate synthase-like GNAT family acetyltransferase
MRRLHVRTHTAWEDEVGYSRLVRVGRQIHVAGTTAFDADGKLVGEGDAYAQTLQCLRNVERALKEVHADLHDVVRTRLYVVDVQRNWKAVGRAHRELLSDAAPASTMLEVARLIDPAMLVEVEVDAIQGSGRVMVAERPRIVEATFEPQSDLARMLRSVDLPLPTESDSVKMLKAYVGGELVGCVGYEHYGEAALLHSLVVIREAKGEGVGRTLVETLIGKLRAMGVKRAFLATEDTTRYFGYLGFSAVARDAVDPDVLASPTLAPYAEDEATFMRRDVR